MNSLSVASIVLTSLVAAVLLGRLVRRHLPEHHLSGDSKDAVKLAMGLVATMTALLLGLLVSSAKDTYDTQRGEVIQMAAKVAFVDRAFALYGPEAAGIRAQFRHTVEEAIHRMWPRESSRPAQVGPDAAAGDALYEALQRLSPQTDLQRSLKEQLVSQATELGELQMLLLAQAVPSVARPLLIAVVGWLLIIFFTFSLLAPPNATTTMAFMVSALSVAGAIFLVLELDRPLGGWIELSSQPMANALKLMAR